jgi:hypothetical protein
VKRVEVGATEITVVFRVSPHPFERRPESVALHYCWRRQGALFWAVQPRQAAAAGSGAGTADGGSSQFSTPRRRGGPLRLGRVPGAARLSVSRVWDSHGDHAGPQATESRPTRSCAMRSTRELGTTWSGSARPHLAPGILLSDGGFGGDAGCDWSATAVTSERFTRQGEGHPMV